MIDGLVSGKLYGTASSKTGQSGKTFVTAKVRAATGDSEFLFVNVIAFDDAAKSALLALDDGDSVALSGTLTAKVWTDKAGAARPALEMVVHVVTTAYHVQRKRKAMPELPRLSAATHEQRRPAMNGAQQAAAIYGGGGGFDDMSDDL